MKLSFRFRDCASMRLDGVAFSGCVLPTTPMNMFLREREKEELPRKTRFSLSSLLFSLFSALVINFLSYKLLHANWIRCFTTMRDSWKWNSQNLFATFVNF